MESGNPLDELHSWVEDQAFDVQVINIIVTLLCVLIGFLASEGVPLAQALVLTLFFLSIMGFVASTLANSRVYYAVVLCVVIGADKSSGWFRCGSGRVGSHCTT